MKIVFYASDKSRERLIAEALKDGCNSYGDTVEVRSTEDYEGPTSDTDVAATFGVKGKSKKILQEHWRSGAHTLYFDKGYIRGKARIRKTWNYWRISVDSFQPLSYFQRSARPTDRWEGMGIDLKPRVMWDNNKFVLYAGSSQKYCDWHNLGDCTGYAKKILKVLRKNGFDKVIYRPKPSWKDAVPIAGSEYSYGDGHISTILPRLNAMITYGSNAAFDAIQVGVPSVVLGDGIARPISSKSVLELRDPYWPSETDRYQWCCDLSYCQWTSDELQTGEAWEHLRREILA